MCFIEHVNLTCLTFLDYVLNPNKACNILLLQSYTYYIYKICFVGCVTTSVEYRFTSKNEKRCFYFEKLLEGYHTFDPKVGLGRGSSKQTKC